MQANTKTWQELVFNVLLSHIEFLDLLESASGDDVPLAHPFDQWRQIDGRPFILWKSLEQRSHSADF